MARFVTGGSPDGTRSAFFVMPGTTVRICAPALKPSLRFHSCGSIGFPAALRGMASTLRSSRRPVALEASGLVNQSLGYGSMHCAGSSVSQPCGFVGSTPCPAQLSRGGATQRPWPLPSG